MIETIKKFLNFGTKSLTVGMVLSAAIVFAICVVIITLILRVVKKTCQKGKMDESYIGYILTVVRIALYFVAIIIACDTIGIPISSLLAVLSVAGLAISLSVQDLLSNLISGFVILVTKPFGGGDFIEIAGKLGSVKAIGFMHTTLLTPDNKIIYIPNHEVSVSNIINYSKESSRRVDIIINVSYDNTVDEVKKSISKSISQMDNIYSDPQPFVGVKEYGSSSIVYDVRVWCDSKIYWDVYYKLNELIRFYFDEDGVKMTYDHLNVHLIDDNKK